MMAGWPLRELWFTAPALQDGLLQQPLQLRTEGPVMSTTTTTTRRTVEALIVLTLMVLAAVVLAVAVITGWLPITLDPVPMPVLGK